jgi:hypothetical protein
MATAGRSSGAVRQCGGRQSSPDDASRSDYSLYHGGGSAHPRPIATSAKFDEALRRRSDVVWAAHVTGVPDVKIMVACEGTEGLDEFLQWLAKQGATDTRTDVVLRPIV